MRLYLGDDVLLLDLEWEPATVEVLAGDETILLHRDREGRPALIEVLGLRDHGLLSVTRLDDESPRPDDRAIEVAALIAAGALGDISAGACSWLPGLQRRGV